MAGVFVATLGAFGASAQTPPLEDECLDALLIFPGAGGLQTFNDEATRSPDDPDLSCAIGPGFGSVFFEFTATETSARIRTDLGSVGLDADFAVYDVDQVDQCDTSLWDEVGCNEDGVFQFNGDTCIEGLVVGLTYKIMLSSFTAGSSGDYTLQIDSPCTSGVPAVCGNGFIDDGEQCDDNNVADGDGCSAVCEIEGGPPGPTPDTTDPVITVPGDINVSTDPGLATAVVNFDDATATDDSGSVTVTQIAGPASGSAFPLGPTTVTFEARDPSDNTAQGSFTVTVTDNEAPVFSPVLGDIFAEATSAAGAVVVFPFATATDNSGSVVVTQTPGPDSGSTFPIGATQVTFEAVDPSGNTAQGPFTVTVLYIFGQFLPPLEDGKIYKANRTLPVKFQITYVGGEPAEEATVGIQVVSLGVDDTPGDPIDLSTNETADTGSVFRFTNGQYIYNLSTIGFTPGKYRITAILSNGQAPFIDIGLR